MNDELRYFARLYFENICLEKEKEENLYNEICNEIKNTEKFLNYSEMLNKICKYLTKDFINKDINLLIFQINNGEKISSNVNYHNLIFINDSFNLTKPILRSELIDFYVNCDDGINIVCQEKPYSKLILEIKDSIKIVQIDENQNDIIVGKYVRSESFVAYVQIDYLDNKEKKHVYFAIIIPKTGQQLIDILEIVKKFLSFRYSIVKKIERDFRGNRMGEKMREHWCSCWLSIDKAGSHSDVKQNEYEIQHLNFNHENTFFPTLINNTQLFDGKNDEFSIIISTLANKQIARIFRRIVSNNDSKLLPLLDSVDAETIEDTIMKLPYNKNISNYTDYYCNSFSYKNTIFYFNANRINKAKLFKKYKLSNNQVVSGMSMVVPLTYKLSYLQAIIVDVIGNMCKYSNEAFIYIEANEKSKDTDYLVFKNDLNRTKEYNNYLLKAKIEFDEIYHKKTRLGFSLATIAAFLNASDALIKTFYMDGYFYIKLPIIQKGGFYD